MSDIKSTTPVHLFILLRGKRYHLYGVENARRPDGRLYMKGSWDDQLSLSKPFAYEIAKLIQRRLQDESRIKVYITLTASESADPIQERENANES